MDNSKVMINTPHAHQVEGDPALLFFLLEIEELDIEVTTGHHAFQLSPIHFL